MEKDKADRLERNRQQARALLDWIEEICGVSFTITGEADMTADFIWGNCTMEELEAHLQQTQAESHA